MRTRTTVNSIRTRRERHSDSFRELPAAPVRYRENERRPLRGSRWRNGRGRFGATVREPRDGKTSICTGGRTRGERKQSETLAGGRILSEPRRSYAPGVYTHGRPHWAPVCTYVVLHEKTTVTWGFNDNVVRKPNRILTATTNRGRYGWTS